MDPDLTCSSDISVTEIFIDTIGSSSLPQLRSAPDRIDSTLQLPAGSATLMERLRLKIHSYFAAPLSANFRSASVRFC